MERFKAGFVLLVTFSFELYIVMQGGEKYSNVYMQTGHTMIKLLSSYGRGVGSGGAARKLILTVCARSFRHGLRHRVYIF